jgi:hypothetical protein
LRLELKAYRIDNMAKKAKKKKREKDPLKMTASQKNNYARDNPGEKRPVGKPTKRTPARQKIILDTLKEYPFRKMAYNSAMISQTCFNTWLREDEEFRLLVEHSENLGRQELVKLAHRTDSKFLLKASDRETFRDQYELAVTSDFDFVVDTGGDETSFES